MKLGAAKTADKLLPKPLSHLIWNILFLLKHPVSLFRYSVFEEALYEKVVGVAYSRASKTVPRKRLPNLRIACSPELTEKLGRECRAITYKSIEQLDAISSTPAVDALILTVEHLEKTEVPEGLPLYIFVDENTSKESLGSLPQPRKYVSMGAGGLVVSSKLICPNETIQRINKQLDKAATKKLSPKQQELIRNARFHFSPAYELLKSIQNNIEQKPLNENPAISVLAPTNRASYLKDIFATFNKQSYPNKELVLVLHGISIPKELEGRIPKNTKIITADKDTLFGDCLNMGLEAATGYLVTKIDDDDIYGKDHLYDLYYGWLESGADVVGKWGHFVHIESSNKTFAWHPEKASQFVGHLPGGTILATSSLLKYYRFASVRNAIDSELLVRLKEGKKSIFSTHQYNYLRVRHQNGHTWQREEEEFIREADRQVSELNDFELNYTDLKQLEKTLESFSS